MKDPLVITNHLSCAHIHKPTHSCKSTHPFIRKQSPGRSRAREEPHSRTSAQPANSKLEQLVCSVVVVFLAPEPVSTKSERCNNELFLFSRSVSPLFIPAKVSHCSRADVLWDASFRSPASHGTCVPICIQILIDVCDREPQSL